MGLPRCLIARAAILLVALIGLGRDAAAQHVRSEVGPLVTPITRRELDAYATMLGFDEERRSLARSLHAGYNAALRQAGLDADARFEALNKESAEHEASNAEQRRDLRKRQMRVGSSYIDQANALEHRLFEDLRALATPEAAAGFESVERARRRVTGLRFSVVSGESVDLVDVCGHLTPRAEAAPELAACLGEYEAELDRALRAKDAAIRRIFERAKELEIEELTPPEEFFSLLDDLHAECVKVRDVNRRHARRLEGMLPEGTRAAFAREFRARSFPKVYRETAADRTLAFARGLADLTPDQRAELSSLGESYSRESAAANDRWAAALDEKHEKLVDHLRRMMGGEGYDPKTDPLMLAVEARRDLDQRFRDRVTRLLTPAQRDRLQEKNIAPSEFDGDFTPDFDEDAAWEEWDKDGG